MDKYAHIFSGRLSNPADTEQLGSQLAALVQAGDFIGLEGDLGAGKTTLARALIQQRYRQAHLPPETVSSPTFNLVQIYDTPPCPIWHLDLYRLKRVEDAEELGWEQVLNQAILLVEWPQILGRHRPPNALTITLSWADTAAEGRQGREDRLYQLTGGGDWPQRLDKAGLRSSRIENPPPVPLRSQGEAREKTGKNQ